MTTITDDFNRANGSLGANYTRGFGDVDGTVIVSNQAKIVATVSGDSTFYIRSAETFGNDQEAFITIVDVTGGSGYSAVACRATGQDGTFACYAVDTQGTSGSIQQYIAGTYGLLANFTDVVVDGDVLGIRVTGSNPVTIDILVNGSVVDTYSDSSGTRISSGGKIAFGGFSNTGANEPIMDNFTGGDVAGGGGGSKLLLKTRRYL